MTATAVTILTGVFFCVALLFSSVGHAGATGYLAAMGLMGVDPAVMRPTALALNVLVAGIGTWNFARAGYFRGSLLWPLALTSIPAAFLGGRINLPTEIYKPVVGMVLLISAARFLLTAQSADREGAREPSVAIRLLVGGLLGFLSGLTGIGGGVFLSPIMLWFRWAGTREVAATSVTFILVNSLAGLAGNWASTNSLPPQIPLWLATVAIGGAIGSHAGSRRLNTPVLRRLLAVVLILSGLKLVLGG